MAWFIFVVVPWVCSSERSEYPSRCPSIGTLETLPLSPTTTVSRTGQLERTADRQYLICIATYSNKKMSKVVVGRGEPHRT
ncbi:hypothetical protein F5B21DRAFT_485957 [Xylaria acuta]|nr:hypothetical protein F5B21DRAFT_485957 [Xylaria acuta]